MDNYTAITVETVNGVGNIRLNRTETNNSISIVMVQEILHALQAYDNDTTIKVITIMGKGKMFSSGADIEEMKDDDATGMMLKDQFRDWDDMSKISKPVITGIHGFAFGGGFELALVGDMIIAGKGSKFGFPEVTIGAMPGAGGTQRLTKLVGTKRAMEWIMLGEPIGAGILYDLGVINHLVDDRLVEESVMKLAGKLAKQPQIALRLIKESIYKAQDYSLHEGMQFERKNFYLLFSTEDQKIGMQSFFDKKPPEFRGR